MKRSTPLSPQEGSGQEKASEDGERPKMGNEKGREV